MAIYSELPVYKAAYDLLLSIFGYAQQFTREYKYTIGEKLKNETVEMITNIYRANSRQDKLPLLQQARENTEVIRLYLRLLRDLHQISLPKFVGINKQIENVSRQLAGCERSLGKQAEKVKTSSS